MDKQLTILVAEDDPAIAELLKYNLQKADYTVKHTANGEEALQWAKEGGIDAAVLDWMLPVLSGVEICRQLRANQDTRRLPILMLTARAEEEDRLRGFEAGVDDYLSKPFSVAELQARIKALLRRSAPAAVEEILTVGDIKMDQRTRQVHRAGETLTLGPTEYKLLRHFLQAPGRVFSREQLLNAVWGSDIFVEIRTVDVHIRRLRKAMNLEGLDDVIRTVRSAGYALEI